MIECSDRQSPTREMSCEREVCVVQPVSNVMLMLFTVKRVSSVLFCCVEQLMMFCARRLRSVVSQLSMFQHRCVPVHHALHLTASAAGDRHNAVNHTKAVIFDLGGVLIPSPIPFLAGK